MEKERWLDFLSARLKSQIAFENSEKLQSWGFGLLSLVSFGYAFNSFASPAGENLNSILNIKIIYLTLSHLVLLFGIYLPNQLQKGEKLISRVLGVRDFTSLTLVSFTLAFYALVNLMISQQLTAVGKDAVVSSFFNVIAWANFFVSAAYLAGLVFYLFSFFTSPSLLVRFAEKISKNLYPYIAIHSAFILLWGMAYGELGKVGSSSFFQEFRLAGAYWIGIIASVLLVGRLLRSSVVSQIANLELEAAAGRLQRGEDILQRFKEVFVSKRLAFWMNRLSHRVATNAHEIAQYTHDAMSLVSRDKPSELDLRSVEERYKKADAIFRKLEKEDQRFLLSVPLFDLNETEREKVEELKNQFSRELRHAKLELASVRKRIDDKLVSIKNSERPLSLSASSVTSSITSTSSEKNSTPVPVEKVPVTK